MAACPSSEEEGMEVDPAAARFEVANVVADNIHLSMKVVEEQFCLIQAEEVEHLSTKAQFEAEHGGTAAFAELIVENHAILESEKVAAANRHEIHRHDIKQEELFGYSKGSIELSDG